MSNLNWTQEMLFFVEITKQCYWKSFTLPQCEFSDRIIAAKEMNIIEGEVRGRKSKKHIYGLLIEKAEVQLII